MHLLDPAIAHECILTDPGDGVDDLQGTDDTGTVAEHVVPDGCDTFAERNRGGLHIVPVEVPVDDEELVQIAKFTPE